MLPSQKKVLARALLRQPRMGRRLVPAIRVESNTLAFINGNRPTQNVYRLNGIIVNDYSNAGPGNVLGANLGVDAIQQFSVLTNNYSAQYGFTSGGRHQRD